jgi:Rrf2 family protein
MASTADRPGRHEMPLRVSAKADYAVRAVAELATSGAGLVKGERIAQAQGIPLRFLLNIMVDLRHAQIVQSHRGSQGGFHLARAPEEITLAQVIRAVEGSVCSIHDPRPEDLEYPPSMGPVRAAWKAVQATLEGALEAVTLADLVKGAEK